jgi:hypothetical protein
MAMPQTRVDSSIINLGRRAARLTAFAFLISGTWFTATAAAAADNSSSIDTRYQAERDVCDSGLSTQGRATCLREAGAALEASKEGRLDRDPSAQHENASIRCNTLAADDRDACQRRIAGEGTTSGSVGSGGVIREIVTQDNQ